MACNVTLHNEGFHRELFFSSLYDCAVTVAVAVFGLCDRVDTAVSGPHRFPGPLRGLGVGLLHEDAVETRLRSAA